METNETRYKMGKLLRKAQTPGDIILIFVILFGLCISIIVGDYLFSQFQTNAAKMPDFKNNNASIIAMQNVHKGYLNWDYAVLFIYIGMTVAMGIIGYFINVQSVFFVIYLIMILIGEVVVGILSYVWDNFAQSTTFYTLVQTSYPILNNLISYAALYFLISAAVSMIATFAKNGGRGE